MVPNNQSRKENSHEKPDSQNNFYHHADGSAGFAGSDTPGGKDESFSDIDDAFWSLGIFTFYGFGCCLHTVQPLVGLYAKCTLRVVHVAHHNFSSYI